MSKEAAAAILVHTLFTVDKSMQNLMMSHAKAGTAKPDEVVKFVIPFYVEMLKAVEDGKDWKDPVHKDGEKPKEAADTKDSRSAEPKDE